MTDTNFILVVEDDPILKNLLGHTLAGKYQTLYANDGNEAIALFDQYHPAMVLLDLMLPTMDGFAVLENIRAHAGPEKSTPVVIVSNLGQQKDIERAKALGANDYLVKAEVAVEEIIAKIEGILASAPPAPATVSPTDVPPSVVAS